ncbi:hypothetical protein DERF_008174 [Dermatophagoides farinae]|uniref:Uncharacterized protein n=1 Tax=Dermatophagoides farinae TaxID=6954 RepID=A0A922I3U6_DERFA|nr:hypothetical protein DERF_008174 [Dermatophagoides farinae]
MDGPQKYDIYYIINFYDDDHCALLLTLLLTIGDDGLFWCGIDFLVTIEYNYFHLDYLSWNLKKMTVLA